MNSHLDLDIINIQKKQESFSIKKGLFDLSETRSIKELIDHSEHVKRYLETPIYSIQNLFQKIPEIELLILPKIFSSFNCLKDKFSCINSVYFDKPPRSNWQLDYHQDLKIKLRDLDHQNQFNRWTKTSEYYEVFAPESILEKIITIRLHLDDCSVDNGALSVIPESNQEGVIDLAHYNKKQPISIPAKEGDVLIMSPLLLHASGNNSSNTRRRVIHLEFSSDRLPWYEYYTSGE